MNKSIIFFAITALMVAACSNNTKITDTSWQTYTNEKEGYSIMHSADFSAQGHGNLMNYDLNDPKYEMGNPDGIKIQIQKHPLNSYKENPGDDFTEPAKTITLGNFVTISQYTKSGPGRAFMVYTAFDKAKNNYFDILVFEPGYSKNKELVEQIIETFKVL